MLGLRAASSGAVLQLLQRQGHGIRVHDRYWDPSGRLAHLQSEDHQHERNVAPVDDQDEAGDQDERG
jgi:hypothetical protein